MQAPTAYHQILYFSQLAAGCDYDVFSAVCRVSRRRNAALSLTGVLLFDGQRFCQLLQGPVQAVHAVMPGIVRDARHQRLVTMVDALVDADVVLRFWAAGYCDAHELDVFDAPDGVRGEAAIEAFRSVLLRADLAP